MRVRALSALRAIEFAVKAKKVYSEPALVTLDLKDSYLTRVLEEITKQTGVRFNASDVDPRGAVSIDVKDQPLFKVLDEICRGQEERTYEWRDESVKFLKDRHVPYPSAYPGPFRIRIVRLKQERSTDFKSKNAQLQLSLDASWQKYLNPAKRFEIEIKKATDDKGGTLEVRKGEDPDDPNGLLAAAGGARIVMRRAVMVAGGFAGDAPGQPQPFTLKGLGAGAVRLTIEGVAKFSFPLDKTDVVFEKPGASESREAGDYSIALKNIAAGRIWSLSFGRAAGKTEGGGVEDIDGRLDKESAVATDEDGGEHKGILYLTNATMNQIVVGGGGAREPHPLATYQIQFPALRNKTLKEIRFKFMGRAFVKTVPFKFENVELP